MTFKQGGLSELVHVSVVGYKHTCHLAGLEDTEKRLPVHASLLGMPWALALGRIQESSSEAEKRRFENG